MKKLKILSSIIIAILLTTGMLSLNVFAIVWPTESTRITQSYSSSHPAIDIGPLKVGVAGDNIYSFSSGEIISYGWHSAAGYTACTNHSTTSSSQYIFTRSSHMTDPDSLSNITKSGSVSSGTKIGEMNTTGSDSQGVHLHYAMRYKDTAYTSSSSWSDGTGFDPEPYFQANLSASVRSLNTKSGSDIAPYANPVADSIKAKLTNNNYGIYYEFDPYATEKSVLESMGINVK